MCNSLEQRLFAKGFEGMVLLILKSSFFVKTVRYMRKKKHIS